MVLWHWFWKGSGWESFQNQCHSTMGPCPIDRTALTAESSGAMSRELESELGSWRAWSWGAVSGRANYSELERGGSSWSELGRAGGT